ncbi:hypothetical protein WDU94_010608 [Cyamophila willieti]
MFWLFPLLIPCLIDSTFGMPYTEENTHWKETDPIKDPPISGKIDEAFGCTFDPTDAAGPYQLLDLKTDPNLVQWGKELQHMAFKNQSEFNEFYDKLEEIRRILIATYTLNTMDPFLQFWSDYKSSGPDVLEDPKIFYKNFVSKLYIGNKHNAACDETVMVLHVYEMLLKQYPELKNHFVIGVTDQDVGDKVLDFVTKANSTDTLPTWFQLQHIVGVVKVLVGEDKFGYVLVDPATYVNPSAILWRTKKKISSGFGILESGDIFKAQYTLLGEKVDNDYVRIDYFDLNYKIERTDILYMKTSLCSFVQSVGKMSLLNPDRYMKKADRLGTPLLSSEVILAKPRRIDRIHLFREQPEKWTFDKLWMDVQFESDLSEHVLKNISSGLTSSETRLKYVLEMFQQMFQRKDGADKFLTVMSTLYTELYDVQYPIIINPKEISTDDASSRSIRNSRKSVTGSSYYKFIDNTHWKNTDPIKDPPISGKTDEAFGCKFDPTDVAGPYQLPEFKTDPNFVRWGKEVQHMAFKNQSEFYKFYDKLEEIRKNLIETYTLNTMDPFLQFWSEYATSVRMPKDPKIFYKNFVSKLYIGNKYNAACDETVMVLHVYEMLLKQYPELKNHFVIGVTDQDVGDKVLNFATKATNTTDTPPASFQFQHIVGVVKVLVANQFGYVLVDPSSYVNPSAILWRSSLIFNNMDTLENSDLTHKEKYTLLGKQQDNGYVRIDNTDIDSNTTSTDILYVKTSLCSFVQSVGKMSLLNPFRHMRKTDKNGTLLFASEVTLIQPDKVMPVDNDRMDLVTLLRSRPQKWIHQDYLSDVQFDLSLDQDVLKDISSGLTSSETRLKYVLEMFQQMAQRKDDDDMFFTFINKLFNELYNPNYIAKKNKLQLGMKKVIRAVKNHFKCSNLPVTNE